MTDTTPYEAVTEPQMDVAVASQLEPQWTPDTVSYPAQTSYMVPTQRKSMQPVIQRAALRERPELTLDLNWIRKGSSQAPDIRKRIGGQFGKRNGKGNCAYAIFSCDTNVSDWGYESLDDNLWIVFGRSQKEWHSEVHFIYQLNTLKQYGVRFQVLEIFTERGPCNGCYAKMEEFLKSAHCTGNIPVYYITPWADEIEVEANSGTLTRVEAARKDIKAFYETK